MNAAALKEEGNACLKAGQLDEAIAKYSHALACEGIATETRLALLSNRALVFIRRGEHERCVEDCTAALALDSSHAKALYRRAQAHAALSQLPAALRDCRLLLLREPKNAEALALETKLK